jgi:hypothetical protein
VLVQPLAELVMVEKAYLLLSVVLQLIMRAVVVPVLEPLLVPVV